MRAVTYHVAEVVNVKGGDILLRIKEASSSRIGQRLRGVYCLLSARGKKEKIVVGKEWIFVNPNGECTLGRMWQGEC